MRSVAIFLLLSTWAFSQAVPASSGAGEPRDGKENTLTIPAGSRIPVALKHAISTKSAREGDAVYAATTFPFVLNDKVLVPAGTYVQGRIGHVQKAGRVKGRAEVLIHFTTLIYPSGYTVMLPGSIENVPGAEKTSMKDKEGTIRQDSDTGKKVGTVASTGATGAVIGGLSHGGKGALIGAGVGGAAGTAIALLTRNTDVRLDAGTTLEMIIQRPVTLDPARVR
jgi:type IV secretion system protein VirB10